MKGATLINAESVMVIDTPVNDQAQVPEKISTSLEMDRKLGSFKMDSLFSRYFTLHQVSLNFKHKAVVASANEGRHFGLALMSMGQGYGSFAGTNKYDILSGNGLFTYNPAVTEEHCFFPDKQTHVNYFEINEDYFNTLLFEHEEFNGGALSKVKEKVNRREFFDAPTRLSSTHLRIISDITSCPLGGSLGTLMLEGSLQQLIALQLSVLGSAQEKNEKINSRDQEIMFAVKDYLHTSFLENHSLLLLSKRFGINHGKLKKCFKSLFGVPVIEYLFNLRMEYAHSLLYNNDMHVSEVSPIVGYRNSNHFATAFKRKFGVNPSRLRS